MKSKPKPEVTPVQAAVPELQYFVFYGHARDEKNTECHQLVYFDSKEDVLGLYDEWLNNQNHTGCSNCVFRVLHGKELILKPLKHVIRYELE